MGRDDLGPGVFLAIPTKRQMINIEQLPFPSGKAAATTLTACTGRRGSRQAARTGIAGALGLAITWLRDAGDLAFMKTQGRAGGAP